MNYGKTVTVHAPFEETVERVRAALSRQGFGVLTEIDITSTMRAKLGVELEQYVLLGACNPVLAHRALELDRTIGLLLPCTVAVRSTPDGTLVQALDPQTMVALTEIHDLEKVADEATARLDAALAELAA